MQEIAEDGDAEDVGMEMNGTENEKNIHLRA